MSARLGLAWICLATACWAFGFGVQSQVVSHWLNVEGASSAAIGWNHAAYYFGLAVASLAVPLAVRIGGSRVAWLGMFLAGLGQLAFPLGGTLLGWMGIRFLCGMAGALSVIPLETVISDNAPPSRRGRYFACYGLAITLGGAVGIWAGLGCFTPGSLLPFFLGGGVSVFGGLLVLLLLPSSPSAEAKENAPPLVLRRNLLSLGTAWYQGFLEGGMLAFLSLFLIGAGFATEEAGQLMALTMVGVIVFQVPVAWFADRCGRRTILVACYAVVLIGLALLPWQTDSVLLAITLFCVGACSGAMYPLGLAILGEGLNDAQVPRAYAFYLALECVGSQLGAAVMGVARDAWGETSMFAVGLGAGVIVLGVAWIGHTRSDLQVDGVHQGASQKPPMAA